MKKVPMRLFDRVLLALYALLGILITIALVVLAISGMRVSTGEGVYLISLGEGPLPIILASLIAAVMLIWSVRVLMLAFRHEPNADRTSVSLQNTENGSVRISVQAVDTLVKQAIGSAEGIVELKTSIINHEDSISVGIEMTLESDVHIPNVTMLMQRSVKNFIEEFSGIAVREVTVLVTRIIEVTPHPPLQLEQGARANEEASAQPVEESEPEPDLALEAEPELEPELEPEPQAQSQPEAEPEAVQAPEFEPNATEAQEDEKDKSGDGFSEKDIW